MKIRNKLRKAMADAMAKTDQLAETSQPKPLDPDEGRYVNGHFVPGKHNDFFL